MRYWKLGVMLAAAVVWLAPAALAQGETAGDVPAIDASSAETIGLAVSAACTMAISVLGAAYAVGRIGSAAMGAAAERPELLTRSILFLALAEGLAVLGFAIAMMLVQKI